jgi:DNA-binding CsgD family transcriptional regulator
MEAGIFRREYDRAQTKTDIFRLFYMACKQFSVGSFIFLDLDLAWAKGLHSGVIFDACPAAALETFLSVSSPESSLERLAAEKYAAWSRQDGAPNFILASLDAGNVVTITVTTSSGAHLMLVLLNCKSYSEGHEFTRQIIEFRDIISRYVDVALSDIGEGALTEKELEIIRWTSRGKNSGEIAISLGLSQHAVNDYLSEAMKKLEASSRIHLVAKCIRLGLI